MGFSYLQQHRNMNFMLSFDHGSSRSCMQLTKYCRKLDKPNQTTEKKNSVWSGYIRFWSQAPQLMWSVMSWWFESRFHVTINKKKKKTFQTVIAHKLEAFDQRVRNDKILQFQSISPRLKPINNCQKYVWTFWHFFVFC